MREARKPAKVKLDLTEAIGTAMESADVSAAARFSSDNRFQRGQEVLREQPSAFTRGADSTPSAVVPIATKSGAPSGRQFDIAAFEVGKVYAVPLALIDPNPWGARHFYESSNVEQIVESIPEGQDVPANGFIKAGRVELFDGGTRLRAARASGLATLDVKIDEPPASIQEQFKRSVRLNSERSKHTELDMAVNVRRLLDEGVYPSADALGEDLELSKSEVSMYRRIAAIPERLLQKMNGHEKTASLTIAYEISGIFARADYEQDADRYQEVAEDVVAEIHEKDLSREKVKTLIADKLQGPKSRLRAETKPIKFGDHTGALKIFRSRGQVDFSIKGLSPEKTDELRDLIERALSGQFPLS